ncbi:hypothetical protein AVEN_25679-1 [Araneus ventricosus]|uniref:Uncharacterized protein n=1 Tax=Araneus ventricosus TaxID=182803 RepID=A0A4Y2WAN6_ARAVE|nr:hypothetical protein AVEN_25679-1 [Araneus ventricosus]
MALRKPLQLHWLQNSELVSKRRYEIGEMINYKELFNHIRFITKKHLAHKNDRNEKHKTYISLITLNKTALAGNEAHLSVMLKMSFSNNTHLDTGHTLYNMEGDTGTSIRNTVSKFLQCWWKGCIHSLFDVSPQKKV